MIAIPDWDSLARLFFLVAIVIGGIFLLGHIFTRDVRELMESLGALWRLEFTTLMGGFSVLAFCALLALHIAPELFQFVRDLLGSHEMAGVSQEHASQTTFIGLVIAFLGNFLIMAILHRG